MRFHRDSRRLPTRGAGNLPEPPKEILFALKEDGDVDWFSQLTPKQQAEEWDYMAHQWDNLPDEPDYTDCGLF